MCDQANADNANCSFKKTVMPQPAYAALFVTALIGLVSDHDLWP